MFGLAVADAGQPVLLLVAGVLYSALGLLEPRLPVVLAGPGLALTGLFVARRRGDRRRVLLMLAALACVYPLARWTKPDFGADSPSYYVYLRSLFFDHDLDFANEWDRWGYDAQPLTPTGLRRNIHAVGSALLWSPFFVAAHGYVLAIRALGSHAYEADGFAIPYVRSTVLGTLTIAVLGAFLLGQALASRFGATLATLAVLAATLASPVPYYLLAQPTMAHGLVFGLAATFVWVWTETAREPSGPRWALLGALQGLLALTRWQAVAYLGLFLPLAVEGLVHRRVRPRWIVFSGLAAFVVFVPQLVVWRVLFGRALAIPAHEHGMDWSSPHLLQVLISADRGLFSWTPLMAVGAAGLAWLLVDWPWFAGGALVVLAASAWINGSVQDWAGADAFGARRFDLVVPLLAVGLAALAQSAAKAVARRPWLAPAVAATVMVMWNVGLMRLYRHRIVKEAAPLDNLAVAQLRQVRRSTEDVLERLGGPRWRNVAYMFFVGEYFYWNTNLSGTIDMAAPEGRYLAGGWSPPHRRPGWPAFRWAYHPRACVRFALENPIDLRIFITARAPNRLPNQAIALSMNRGQFSWRPLPSEWTDVHYFIPASWANRGENLLCAHFSDHLAAEEGAEEGKEVAAAVTRIQLP